jgi:FkbM family methyltransferase
VRTAELTPKSIIYSAGVGDNIAWDLAMIDRFGVTVHAFDPTPMCIKWIDDQSLPPRFRFQPVGLAARDGLAQFRVPRRGFNFTPDTGGGVTITAPVRRLSTLMRELGHDHLDVLKLDIEGSEYDVLADLLGEPIPVRQLLVEFHHNFPTIPFARTEATVRALSAAGYRLFDVSDRGLELSFLGPNARPAARARQPKFARQ